MMSALTTIGRDGCPRLTGRQIFREAARIRAAADRKPARCLLLANKKATIEIGIGYLTTTLGAAAAAVAIVAAPTAAAAVPEPGPAPPHQSCAGSGAGTVCQSPGNVQINDAPPPVQFYPYGGEAFLL